jgi:hypothetical protein
MPLSAPTAVNPASQSTILGQQFRPDPQRWDSRSRAGTEHHPAEQQPLAEPHGVASNYPNRSQDRHSPAPGGNYGPQRLTNTSPHQQQPSGAWRSLRHDEGRGSTKQLTDAPLMLHIPNSKG